MATIMILKMLSATISMSFAETDITVGNETNQAG